MSIGRFVDVERIVIRHLTDSLTEPGLTIAAQLPDPFTDHDAATGTIRVTRAPGGETWPTSMPRVDVEVFHTHRAGLWQLAGRAHAAMAALQGKRVGDAPLPVDAVYVRADPVMLAWSPTILRTLATYEPQFTTA